MQGQSLKHQKLAQLIKIESGLVKRYFQICRISNGAIQINKIITNAIITDQGSQTL